MKQILILLSLCLFFGCDKSKEKTEVAVNPDIERALVQIQTARDSVSFPVQQRKDLLYQAVATLNEFERDSNYLKNLSQVALVSYRLKDSALFRQVNKKALKLSTKKKEYNTQGESHWDLGTFYDNNGKRDSAFYHFRAAYHSFNQLPVDSTSLSRKARMLNEMAKRKLNI